MIKKYLSERGWSCFEDDSKTAGIPPPVNTENKYAPKCFNPLYIKMLVLVLSKTWRAMLLPKQDLERY